MKRVVFATNNSAKVKEIKSMLQSESVEVLMLSDLELILVPEETGTSFEENAIIKAKETAALLRKNGHTQVYVLADDSGIEIDALNDVLGVDSANFMGADTAYEIRNAKILELLAGIPDSKRTARYVCVIACILPSGETITTRGTFEGTIAHTPLGSNGFGYDPIFHSPQHNKTAAQLSDEEKNKISHRGIALREMISKINF